MLGQKYHNYLIGTIFNNRTNANKYFTDDKLSYITHIFFIVYRYQESDLGSTKI